MSRWNDEDRTPLARLRANSGLSMEKAAVAIDINSRTLGRYENGFSDIPMRVAEKLANLYKIPFATFCEAVFLTPLKH